MLSVLEPKHAVKAKEQQQWHSQYDVSVNTQQNSQGLSVIHIIHIMIQKIIK